MTVLTQDLRYAFRMLNRNRGLSVAAVVTLIAGIGANTAMFSVANAVLLNSPPYHEPDRLVALWSTFSSDGARFNGGSSLPDFEAWRDGTRALADAAAYWQRDVTLTGSGAEAEHVMGVSATTNLFDVLGVSAAAGRTFRADDGDYGRHGVVVLSHGLWQRRFGGADVIGRAILVDGRPHTVIGVMPEAMIFMDGVPPVQLWVPLAFAPGDGMATRDNHFLGVIARLTDDATVDEATAQAAAIAAALESEHPQNADLGVAIEPLQEALRGDARMPLLLLSGAVGLVLLLSCANVAGLLLIHGASRARELAVRASLGAQPGRLLRQLIVEALPLGVLGGTGGVLAAAWLVEWVVARLPGVVPRYHPIEIDLPVLAFAAGTSMGSALLAALVPAVRVATAARYGELVTSGRGAAASHAHHRARAVLVVSQVAVAIILLVGTGLMLRSLSKLYDVDIVQAPERVLTMSLPLAETRYPEPEDARRVVDRMLVELNALPGAERAGATSTLPLNWGGGWGKYLTVADRPAPTLSSVPLSLFALVSDDYFEAIGMPVLRGRGFGPADTATSQPVAVVNAELARVHFSGRDPIGEEIYLDQPLSLRRPDDPASVVRRTIVGVVADVPNGGSVTADVRPMTFVPYDQSAGEGWARTFSIAIRTSGPPEDIAAAAIARVHAVDPNVPVSRVVPLTTLVDRTLAGSRFVTELLVSFGAVALVLVTVGLYGVIAYWVTRRTSEIGVRLALGASRTAIRRLVLGQGARLAVAGTAIGLVASLGTSRLLASQLFGVGPVDAATLVAVASLMLLIAVGASLIPASRAASLEPMVALRRE